MRRQPGFTAIAVVTLALGIGANTAIVSVVRSVLLAPLPFRDAGRLVRLTLRATDATGRVREGSPSPAVFHAVRDHSRLVERVAAQRFQNLTLTGDGEPARVVATAVSDQWAETLGIRPILGRSFSEEEQRDGDSARVALVGHGFWTRRFGASPNVLGQPLRLNDRVYTIIGVMPPQFRYPYNTEVWLPMTVPPERAGPGDLNTPARMRPGVSHAAFDDELTRIVRTGGLDPESTADLRLVGVPMREEFRRDPNQSIATLAVAVGFVLLVACVNLATLLLARGGARSHELALRAAIGASQRRLIRQLLTESVLLAAAGGAAGMFVALGASRSLTALIPPRLGEVIQQVRIDGGVLAVSALLCVLTGVLFGLAPALRLTRRNPGDVLRDGGRPGAERGGSTLRMLVVGEVALATVLLTGAGLMGRNFVRLLSADVGYEAAGLMRINVGLPESAYADPGRRVATVREIEARVSAVPGVAAAGVTMLQPIPRTRANIGTSFVLDAAAVDPTALPPVVNRRLVTPGYFRAMGLRLVAGRGFTGADDERGALVAVVNQRAARRFWPESDAVGRRVKLGGPDGPWRTVVGVVSDMAEPYDQMRETVFQPVRASDFVAAARCLVDHERLAHGPCV